MTFKEQVLTEYPLPIQASIWNNPTIANLDDMIRLCFNDLQTDVEIYEHTIATGLHTILPEGTRMVSSVRLQVPFQGNTYVKWTYDPSTRVVHCRFTPSIIKYKRSLKVEDLDNLTGSRSLYCRTYTIIKMLEKEISYLSSIKLTSDVGEINIDALTAKKNELLTTLKEMKDDIMLYSNI